MDFGSLTCVLRYYFCTFAFGKVLNKFIKNIPKTFHLYSHLFEQRDRMYF